MSDDEWTETDANGVRLRMDGANRKFVFVWADDTMSVETIGSLCGHFATRDEDDRYLCTPAAVWLREGTQLLAATLDAGRHGGDKFLQIHRGGSVVAVGSYRI